MPKRIVTSLNFSKVHKNRNRRRNERLFIKSASVNLLMRVHIAVYNTGDIL